MTNYDSFSHCHLTDIFFRYSRGSERVKRHFTKGKDLVEKSSRPGVGYHIPCRDCTDIYIGETGRAYKTRLAEHKRDLKPANLAKVNDNNFNKKTALVKHVITKDHRVELDHSKILSLKQILPNADFSNLFYS